MSSQPDEPQIFSWVSVFGLASLATAGTVWAIMKMGRLGSGPKVALAIAAYVLMLVAVVSSGVRASRRPPVSVNVRAAIWTSFGAAGLLSALAERSAVFDACLMAAVGGFATGTTVTGIRKGLALARDGRTEEDSRATM